MMGNNLVLRLSTIDLSQERDGFQWNLDQTCVFSVKSHYLGLINQNTPNLNERIWKLKAPLKIKIFLWFLRRGVILTKDNFAKRNWQGTTSVVSVMKIKLYKICFLTIDSREWYGLRSMRPGAYQNLIIFLVWLGAGSMRSLKIISH